MCVYAPGHLCMKKQVRMVCDPFNFLHVCLVFELLWTKKNNYHRFHGNLIDIYAS